MTTNDDIGVEVSGGYLLVAMKIPTLTCGICGSTASQETLEPNMLTSVVRSGQPLICAFKQPKGWTWVTSDRTSVSVCSDCAAPINAARAAGEKAEEAARAAVAAKIPRAVAR